MRMLSKVAGRLALWTLGLSLDLSGCGISDTGLDLEQHAAGEGGGSGGNTDKPTPNPEPTEQDAGAPPTGGIGAAGGIGGIGVLPDAAPPTPDTATPPPVPDAAPPLWRAGRIAVAVGTGGRRMVSSDGVVWKGKEQDVAGTADSDRTLVSAAFARSRVVAVGGGCSNQVCRPRIMSFNGATWTEHTAPNDVGRLTGVAFGQGRWVVVGDRGPALTSDDGVKWKGVTQTSGRLRALAFGKVGTQDMFVAVGANSLRIRSLDGLSWDHMVEGPPGPGDKPLALAGVAIGGGAVVAAGDGGRRVRSVDGKTWTHLAGGGERLHTVVFHAEKFWAHSSNGVLNLSSDQGQSWSPIATIEGPEETLAVGRLDRGDVFVGGSWPAKISSSPDGVGFNSASAEGENAILKIVLAGP